MQKGTLLKKLSLGILVTGLGVNAIFGSFFRNTRWQEPMLTSAKAAVVDDTTIIIGGDTIVIGTDTLGWDPTTDTTFNPYDSTFIGWDSTFNPFDSTIIGWDTTINPWDSTFIGWDSTFNPWDTTIIGWDTTINPWDTTIIGWDTTINPWDTTIIGWDTTINPWDTTIIGWDSTFNPWDSTFIGWDSTFNPFDSTFIGIDSIWNGWDSTFNPYDSTLIVWDSTLIPHDTTGGTIIDSLGGCFNVTTVYPQPVVNNDLNIKVDVLSSSAQILVEIRGANGLAMYSQPHTLSTGPNTITINTGNLAPGIYYLNMIGVSCPGLYHTVIIKN